MMTEKELQRYRSAAMRGDRDAQHDLACFYHESVQDIEQAEFWYRKSALGGCGDAILKCRELNIELYPEKQKKSDLRCRLFRRDFLADYVFVVVCSYYKGKWILSRHIERDTWETQGGHIEEGETPLDAAVRELYEESGITDADVHYICDYWGFNALGSSNGAVFYAHVRSVGQTPESEMSEIKMFEVLPEELTYPGVTPVFMEEADKYRKKLYKDTV